MGPISKRQDLDKVETRGSTRCGGYFPLDRIIGDNLTQSHNIDTSALVAHDPEFS